MLARKGRERARGAGLAAPAPAGKKDLAHRVEPADARNRDAAGVEVGLDRKPGDERDAVFRDDGAPHRFLQPELELDVDVAQPHTRLAQLVLDDLADTRPLLHDDQLLSPQIVQGDRFAREAMTGRTGEHDLVAKERLERNAPMAASRADDAELELSLRDLVDHGLSVRDGKSHAHLRMLLLELAEQQRDDRSAGARRRAEVERAGDRAQVVRIEILEQMLLGGQQPLRRRIEPAAGLRGFDTPPGAVEKLPAEPLLERADLEADGRLGHSQPLRGLGEALPLDHRAERGKLARVHKHSLCNADLSEAGFTIPSVQRAGGTRPLLLSCRVAVAATFAFVVALWIDGPKTAGDTPFVLDGTDAVRACLSRGDLHACGFTGHLNVWGLMSPIGDWPLLQHVPDLIATSLGISAHSDRVRILVLLNIAGVVSSVLLAGVVLRRVGQEAWFWGFLLVVLSGPLLAYTSISWGEALASGLLVAFVAAALLPASPPLIMLAALCASLTKETAYPFIFVVGLLGLVLARGRTGTPIRRHLVWGAAGLALGIVLTSLLNVVRFGSVLNTNYLQPELHTPGIGRKLEYAAGLVVAPNGGILFFWPAATALLSAALLLPLMPRFRHRVDPRPAIVVAVVVIGLLVGLASWWTPFGWSAWGPRLSLPWLSPLILLLLAAYGQELGELAGRLLAARWRLGLVAACIVAFALPHVGYMWREQAREEFFTATSGPCATRSAIGSPQQRACQHEDLWFRRPMLLYGLRGLETPGGAVTGIAVAIGLIGCLILLREGLVTGSRARHSPQSRRVRLEASPGPAG
jgi:hypothetical protein